MAVQVHPSSFSTHVWPNCFLQGLNWITLPCSVGLRNFTRFLCSTGDIFATTYDSDVFPRNLVYSAYWEMINVRHSI